MLSQIKNLLINHPRKLIWPFLILALISLPIFRQTSFDNSLQVLYQQGNAIDQKNRAIQKSFGNIDELVVLAYHHPQLFSHQQLQFITTIQNDLIKISGIKSCYSLASIPYFWNQQLADEIITHSDPFLSRIPKEPQELADLQKRALNNSTYLKNVISEDGTTAGFNIIFSEKLNSLEKEQVVKKIIALHQSYQTDGQFYLTGMHVFMESSGRYLQRDILVFTSCLIVVMLLALILLFKNIKAALATLLSAGISILFTVSTLNLLGLDISIATTAVPAIISSLCIAYTIHIFCADIAHLKEVLLSNLLAGITSMLGFASMSINPMPTVKQLGIYLVIGTFYSVIVSTFFSTALKTRYFINLKRQSSFPSFNSLLLNIVRTKKTAIYLASFVLLLLGISIFHMELDTNYYKYYRQETDLTRSIDFVNQHLSGQYPLIVQLESQHNIKDSQNLELLQQVSSFARSQKGVDKVLSLIDLLEQAYGAFENPIPPQWHENRELVEEMHMLVESSDRTLLSYYLTSDEKKSLIFIRTNLISSRDYKALQAQLEQFLATLKPIDGKFSVSGTYINIVESADKMSKSQLISSFFAVTAILIVIFLALRTIKFTIIAAIANLLPIIAIYGIMGLMGESINMGTAIIAAMAFGIAVDDTIHFIIRFNYAQRRHNYLPDQAIEHVFRYGITSIIFTSIVVGSGFLVLGLSSFRPVYQLGIYTALTIILCLLIDVIMLPRMLYDTRKL